MAKHYHIILKGNFRYSGFRFHSLMAAHALSITGVVREQNGNIIIEAEGEEANLEEFIKWCRSGDRTPTPESVKIAEKPLAYFSEFMIL